MLILDLDDTIFQTNTMDPSVFESAFFVIDEYYGSVEKGGSVDTIISELWSTPLDKVFTKHQTPEHIVSAFYQQIATIDFRELGIKTFPDYSIIQSLSHRKTLVTTGLKELQLAKIKALGIESDFESIKIDDPRLNPRQYKLNLFEQILKETNIPPEDIWVIGDNPESEIKAGKELGMNTIQRRSSSKTSSEYSDYEIDSFVELIEIFQ